jgi:hypothetical protein
MSKILTHSYLRAIIPSQDLERMVDRMQCTIGSEEFKKVLLLFKAGCILTIFNPGGIPTPQDCFSS